MFDIRMRRSRWRMVAVPVGAVALVGLAACGTSTDTSAASSGSTPTSAASGSTSQNATGDADSSMAAFRTCMAQNGVTLPERSGRPGDGGTPLQGGAAGAPPSGALAAPGDGSGSGTPDGGPGRTPGQAPPGVDATAWAAAQKACADLAPTPPGGGAAPATGSAS